MPTPDEDYCDIDGYIWLVRDLWEAAKGLPVEEVAISSLREVESGVSWLYNAYVGVWSSIDERMERVHAADTSFPAILHPDGWLMDGHHRTAKVLWRGGTHLKIVRLTPETLPEIWGIL